MVFKGKVSGLFLFLLPLPKRLAKMKVNLGDFKRLMLRVLRDKYMLTLLVFVVWITFFDSNNLVDRFVNMRELYQLKKDKEYFRERIDQDRSKLEELRTDKENLEKFARERYLMKKPDEDVFVIVSKEK
jgi:cell division protein FtsB